MIAKFKITFTDSTEVEFIDPVSMRKEWYKCFYGRGTSVEVADLLSGNTQHIFTICTDGEIMSMNTRVVRIESI